MMGNLAGRFTVLLLHAQNEHEMDRRCFALFKFYFILASQT